MAQPSTIPATEPRCPTCDWPGYDDLRKEVKRLRAAYLAHIQMENACKRTGAACREPAKCGCYLECQNLIAAAVALTGHETGGRNG